MSISSAITAAQGRVADCYTAISNKGGTLPATQNLANMPTAIGSIPSGGGTKFGASIDSLIGDVDANGVLQFPSVGGNLVFTGVKDVVSYGLYYKFYNNQQISSVNLQDLLNVSGDYALTYSFYSCKINQQTLDLSSLTTVSGNYALSNAFRFNYPTHLDLSSLTTVSGNYALSFAFSNSYSGSGTVGTSSVDLSSLTTISGQSAFSSCFSSARLLQSISFDSLETINNSSIFSGCFGSCERLGSIYFNSLKTTSFGSYTNQFNNMFDSSTASTSGTCTVHFPSNLQSTISGLTGYPTFGGNVSRIILAFDLPATT